MSCTIIVDDREKDIYPCLISIVESQNCSELSCKKQRIAVGDFLILIDGEIKMIIERKTMKDLSASIKDGRTNSQIEKMKQKKSEIGCSLLYIIECSYAFPEKNKKFEGIPYKNLLAKLRHNMIRDSIPHMKTKNHTDTAELIFDLASDYIKLTNTGQLGEQKNISDIQKAIQLASLSSVEQKKDIDILLAMWSSLPGINKQIALSMIGKIKIADILLRITTCDDLGKILLINGKTLGLSRAKKILSFGNEHIKKMILSIPKIGAKTCAKIEMHDIRTFYNLTENEIAALSCSDGTKVGTQVAKNLFCFLSQ